MRNLNPTTANRSGQPLMRVFAALLALVGALAIGTFALRGNASALAQLPPLAEDPAGTIDMVPSVTGAIVKGTPFSMVVRLTNISGAVQTVDAGAMFFNFDPTKVQVVINQVPIDPEDPGAGTNPVPAMTAGLSYPTILTRSVDNTLGQANYVGGKDLTQPTPTINPSASRTLVTITFNAIECGDFTVAFVFGDGSRDSAVTPGVLLRDAVNTTFTVTGVDCLAATPTTVPATATTVPATATTVPATATTVPATATTVPATATTVPATATTVPATATTVPATATTVLATNTSVAASPTASATATATEVVASPTASATATATEVVASPTASATATATEVVASPTASATATATEVAATATNVVATATEIPATATAISDPTATTVPATEVPATATMVIATNTLTPEIVTNTPVPGTATATLSGVDLTATATAGAGGGTATAIPGTATAVAPAAGTCGLPIPSGSVVGAMPFGAQAFWAPGKLIQPSLMVNPGSYWVIGQDASETYYNILIACAYIWVRKDTMGTYSDGKNWFNNPLPTRIIS